MEISIKITDEQGHEVEVIKKLQDNYIISHDFSKIESLVEDIRTDMLKEVEHELLKKNQAEYLKKSLD